MDSLLSRRPSTTFIGSCVCSTFDTLDSPTSLFSKSFSDCSLMQSISILFPSFFEWISRARWLKSEEDETLSCDYYWCWERFISYSSPSIIPSPSTTPYPILPSPPPPPWYTASPWEWNCVEIRVCLLAWSLIVWVARSERIGMPLGWFWLTT